MKRTERCHCLSPENVLYCYCGPVRKARVFSVTKSCFDTERSGKMAGRRKRSADREEILEFLTAVMRNEELSDKDRMSAAFKLGRYLGLETGSAD